MSGANPNILQVVQLEYRWVSRKLNPAYSPSTISPFALDLEIGAFCTVTPPQAINFPQVTAIWKLLMLWSSGYCNTLCITAFWRTP